MDQSLEVTNVKPELIDSMSSERMEIPTGMKSNSVEKENNCLVQSDIHIKTEEEEDENEFAAVPSTSYQLCLNCDMTIETDEPMVKIEYKDVLDELMKDPLNVDSEIKVKEHFPIDLGQSESGIKTEPTEAENEDNLLQSNEDCNSDGSALNLQDNLLNINDPNCKNKQYSCNECNKIFRQECHLDNHLCIHIGKKPYICAVCTTSFKQKCHLKQHLLIHSGKNSLACDVCQKVFYRKGHLDSHKLIHSGLKQFSCKDCNKSFAHKHDLAIHQRIHSGEKPFACDLCDKAYTQKIHLISHRRLHTGEKPYSCDICKKSYAHKSGLNYHKRFHIHY